MGNQRSPIESIRHALSDAGDELDKMSSELKQAADIVSGAGEALARQIGHHVSAELRSFETLTEHAVSMLLNFI